MNDITQILQMRAKLYADIRDYFDDALEVHTPIASRFGGSDVHLASVQASIGNQICYLHTSPEFYMKKLLGQGAPDIYQICSVFRDFESGLRHHNEFAMLEWYRRGKDLTALMQDVHALITHIMQGQNLPMWQVCHTTYKSEFMRALGINPHDVDINTLQMLAHTHGIYVDLGDDRLGYIDLLFSHLIEPNLGFVDGVPCLTFVVDFLAQQAALAKTYQVDGDTVAARFEIYVAGLELANGYDELNDATILQARFIQDNQIRADKGLPIMPIDSELLACVDGMGQVAGIALGLDRLLMLISGRRTIDKVALGFL